MVLRRASGVGPYAAALLASGVLGAFAIRAILERAGRPAVPLDDVFIHFQYARRLAEGAPFRYTGDAISTGATSLVWPALLAPFWKLGARGLSLVWAAWALGTVAHAGVAIDTALLARRLTSKTGALAAGAMCLAFGPFAWFAWSGMETMALAWVLVRGVRLAAEVLDRASEPRIAQLAALGFVAPLVRPEGALVSAVAALAIALRTEGKRRALAAVPLLGCAVLPAVFFALTGDPAGTTARVKWLVYNPYFDAGRLAGQIGYHARLLVTDVWNGGEWTWILVPPGLAIAFLLGALALVRSARRAPWAAGLTAVLLAATFATCSYQSFLWNRVRYAWPFVPAGFVMCACFAHEVGLLLGRARPALRMATPILGLGLAARLAAELPSSLGDLSQSAAAVDQQQVKLAEWVRVSLPADAIVGVNDTGAIAYIGEHRTFDIVGLTTPGEGPAWVAGPGSRYERYERLPRAELPSVFLVYPEWFGCDALLGQELASATVYDHAILGGDTMSAHAASFSLLGAGALPEAPPPGELADEIDVADLESEAAHGFELGDAWDTDNIARAFGQRIDGGRAARARDSFRASIPTQRAARLVLRLGADEPLRVRVLADGEEAGTLIVPASAWTDLEIPLPASRADRVKIDVVALDPNGMPISPRPRGAGARFASFHYWVYAR
jgi:hypothetical protein